MTSRQRYDRAHRFGKECSWAASSTLLIILLFQPHWALGVVVLLINNYLYWHGTNMFAYLYETWHHWKHKHHKL